MQDNVPKCIIRAKSTSMKTKYFLIYVCVGIAFLAVSAWVYFTRGQNAKAIRAKYKLGGIMLTCMAMLSVVSCGEILGPDSGFVTCYDVAYEDNITSVTIKHGDSSFQDQEIAPGDVFDVNIQFPTFEKYMFRVVLSDKEETVLQKTKLTITDAENAHFEIPLSTDVTYKGGAILKVNGIVKEDPEELASQTCFVTDIIIR